MTNKKENIFNTVLLILACGGIGFLMKGYRITGFLEGAFTPVLFFLIVTVFQIPSYFVREKDPGAAKWLRRIGYITATIGMFIYIIGFFIPDVIRLITETPEDLEPVFSVIGFGLTAWGYVYHILERCLIFDRRHVTGISGFTALCFGVAMSAASLLPFSKELCISYVLLLIIIYQLIDHFIEEKEYPEDDRFKKPGA